MKTIINKKTNPLKLTKVLMVAMLAGLGFQANAQCNADYTYLVDTISSSGQVTFTNTSTTSGSGTYYYMDYGDGVTNSFSGAPTLTHTYLTGTYTACLIMIDSVPVCSDTMCYTFSVINAGSPVGGCSAYFIPNDSAGYVYFSDLSSGSGLAYSWDYGDGSFGSIAGTNAHSYTAPGTYIACLTVSSFLGCSSTFCDTITISPGTSGACLGSVTTYFTATDSAGYGVFTNGVTGTGPVYHWDFGDGNTSSNPGITTHLYAANGTYNVCLTVYETGGTYDSCQYCSTVTIGSILNCDASFTIVQDTNDLYSYFVYNNNTSPGSGTDYYWDFGDGFTSTSMYPTHTYTGTGPYYLCLTVLDTVGFATCADMYCDSLAAGRSSGAITVTVVAPMTTGISEQSISTSLENYPNPFNGSTTINYAVSEDAAIELNVVDLLGNRIAALEKDRKTAGSYTVTWNAESVSQGMYLLQMKANNKITIKKIIVSK